MYCWMTKTNSKSSYCLHIVWRITNGFAHRYNVHDVLYIGTKLQWKFYRKSNIFDNMIAIMEKYSKNLEEIVEERTNQLREEKRRTEELLHQMLPEWVRCGHLIIIITVVIIYVNIFLSLVLVQHKDIEIIPSDKKVTLLFLVFWFFRHSAGSLRKLWMIERLNEWMN